MTKQSQTITAGLEDIARLARTAKESDEVKRAIEALRNACHPRESGDQVDSRLRGNDSLQELDKELSTWESKLDVIWKEPVGREGMAKHAEYWVEKLQSLRGGTK